MKHWALLLKDLGCKWLSQNFLTEEDTVYNTDTLLFELYMGFTLNSKAHDTMAKNFVAAYSTCDAVH